MHAGERYGSKSSACYWTIMIDFRSLFEEVVISHCTAIKYVTGRGIEHFVLAAQIAVFRLKA